MTITNGYTTLLALKKDMGFNADDFTWDDQLETAITLTSRAIDNYCHRRFWTTTSDETRYYTPVHYDVLLLPDDLLSVTTLATDPDDDRDYDYTWAATDYDLCPYNAAVQVPPQPYLWIAVTPDGDYSFPAGHSKSVKIVGKFGFCANTAVPPIVEWCCRREAQRRFKLKDAPFGVAGSIEAAQLISPPGMDKTVQESLEPFVREDIYG